MAKFVTVLSGFKEEFGAVDVMPPVIGALCGAGSGTCQRKSSGDRGRLSCPNFHVRRPPQAHSGRMRRPRGKSLRRMPREYTVVTEGHAA